MDPRRARDSRGLLEVVISFDKPLLAAVHGVGVGLGCTLLAHVDLVLLDESARLRVPFAELGVPPEAASSWLLPERMGWQRAAALLLASEWIDADTAVDVRTGVPGLPERNGPRRDHGTRPTDRFVPRAATRQIKQLMMAPHREAIGAARGREEAAFAALFADPANNPGSQLTAGLDR